MNKIPLKTTLWLTTFFWGLLIGCEPPKKTSEYTLVDYDSVATDILNADVISMHDARNLVQVPDHIFVEDTLKVTETFMAYEQRPTRNRESIFYELKSGMYLIVSDVDKAYAKCVVYSKANDSIATCFLGRREAIIMRNPLVNEMKIEFYEKLTQLVTKRRLAIARKYSLSEAEVDSLAYLTIPRLDSLRAMFERY